MNTQSSLPPYVALEVAANDNGDLASKEEHAPNAADDPAEATVADEGSSPIVRGISQEHGRDVVSVPASPFSPMVFFCPADASLSWEERGKCAQVECLICYA